MNVYSKLQRCRVQLQSEPLKKSGKNTFAKYDYFELGDFMPTINRLFLEAKLCGVVSFSETTATLTIINTEKPEETVVFMSPMSTADLKGCHSVQNLGAVQTYLRRYLYVDALEIVEHDALDSTTGNAEEKRKPAQEPASPPPTKPQKPAVLSDDQQKYFPRVKAALDTLYGDDTAAKKSEIKKLTTFPEKKDGKETGKMVDGVDDYRKLDGKRLQILCARLEKSAESKQPPVPAPNAASRLPITADVLTWNARTGNHFDERMQNDTD